MNLQEVLAFLRLDGSERDQLRQYAEMLEEDVGRKVLVAEELLGDTKSLNGLCVWDKKKAFICKHKHDVSFEVISRVFENPPPKGCEIIDPDGIDSSGEYDEIWVRVNKNRYIVIKYEEEGSLIRLISAWKANATRRIGNSVEFEAVFVPIRLYSSVRAQYDSRGNVVQEPDVNVVRWCELYTLFLDGLLSAEDTLFFLMMELDLSEKHASGFVEDWQQEKNTNYLSRQMGKL